MLCSSYLFYTKLQRPLSNRLSFFTCCNSSSQTPVHAQHPRTISQTMYKYICVYTYAHSNVDFFSASNPFPSLNINIYINTHMHSHRVRLFFIRPRKYTSCEEYVLSRRPRRLVHLVLFVSLLTYLSFIYRTQERERERERERETIPSAR